MPILKLTQQPCRSVRVSGLGVSILEDGFAQPMARVLGGLLGSKHFVLNERVNEFREYELCIF